MGRICWTEISALDLPAVRAARTYSRVHSPMAAPRATRVKTGMLNRPMAMMALIAPGPKTAVIITASSRAGKAKIRSLPRITSSSTQPPRAAAVRPSGTPIPAPMPTATRATASEFCAPTMIIDRTSRPK
ncbi:hypothetical protein D3C85_1061980 [compost metagenome]